MFLSAISLICVSLWIHSTMGTESNFTFSYKMASRCKEHICQHGYTYEVYYRVDSDDRRTSKRNPDIAFEMHLAILAASNGHIVLSEVPYPDGLAPVYEIVVGGGGNKFTELRRNLRRNGKTSVKTEGILSPIEFRAFYIKISEDGLIEFGREGDKLPILTYFDLNAIQVKYFSFAAWNTVEAKFLYDCPAPGQNVTEPDSEAVEPKMSNSDQLKRILLMDRQRDLPPAPSVPVRLGVRITNVKYDAFDARLTTGLAIVVSWTDESLAWNPSKFNVTQLTFRQGQIWRPTFFVINSDNIGEVTARNTELISMQHSGKARFHMQTTLQTWCVDYSTTLSRWPHDEYNCNIRIGAWEAHETIIIDIMDPKEDDMKIFADLDEITQNEWEVTGAQKVFSFNTRGDNETQKSDAFVISLNLKRTATSYNIAFYTPLLVLVTFVLLSFWSDPLQMSRIWFYAGSTVVICMALCYIDFLVPCHTVPSILVLYITVLIGVLIALLTQTMLMTTTAQNISKTPSVQNILSCKILRAIFCLPAMTVCRRYECINEACTAQEDDDDSGVVTSQRSENVEEMQTDNTKYGETEELAEVIDKSMFVIYSVVFAVMLTMHF